MSNQPFRRGDDATIAVLCERMEGLQETCAEIKRNQVTEAAKIDEVNAHLSSGAVRFEQHEQRIRSLEKAMSTTRSRAWDVALIVLGAAPGIAVALMA